MGVAVSSRRRRSSRADEELLVCARLWLLVDGSTIAEATERGREVWGVENIFTCTSEEFLDAPALPRRRAGEEEGDDDD